MRSQGLQSPRFRPVTLCKRPRFDSLSHVVLITLSLCVCNSKPRTWATPDSNSSVLQMDIKNGFRTQQEVNSSKQQARCGRHGRRPASERAKS